jgi:hypothetical protein
MGLPEMLALSSSIQKSLTYNIMIEQSGKYRYQIV